ncbi:hypothetical protein CANARDRAFT_28776 [[Candida] arabinofermentans NRRL YB-2248]|uniref:CAP-Gly domain-containing protein n=1 Tax=[Candida] arabinofermentans NRRL YB-2248 TaxID=983967 RepID=A0A1E4SZW5_9ASCO|nr:hypothetical protein CANARDRAFT_28776 [[Candida] arabinofermentans NRRL YB-2248]
MEDINVYITSDLTSSERRISPNWSLSTFKNKLHQITGIPPIDQKLWLYKTKDTSERSQMRSIHDDSLTQLYEFHIIPYTRIHIENTNLENEELLGIDNDLDNSDVKFDISESEYDSLPNTVKKWKQENKLGRFDPEFQKKKTEQLQNNLKLASTLNIGDRCKINTNSDSDSPLRIGTIKYVGRIPEIDDENVWVGVQLDEPTGKNNGSVKGTQYFKCLNNYGVFVKPMSIEVGEFSNDDEGLFDSDSDDEL